MTDRSLLDNKEELKKISLWSIGTFLLTLTLCLSLVFTMVWNRSKVEKLVMEQLILEKSIQISDAISKLLYKTQMLSSLVLQNDGEVVHFEQIAATMIDDPAILNILLAPDGLVSFVYPLEGNEQVLGLNFFAEGTGNKEAVMAKETGQLILGGPFDAVQGGQILVGRLPVFIEGPDGAKIFWGLVSVTLKYPQALDRAGLNELQIQGYAYEIWRINPDNNGRQIIASSGHSYRQQTNYVEKQLSIANANWYFRILPVRMWYEFPETWASILISICVSFLVAAVIQNNQDLKTLKKKLERLSSTDSLTAIHNRRYFMESAAQQMERVNRLGSESYVILFDLDHFKEINDCYGHQIGDEVLKDVAARIKKTLRSYDLFARYGGEEFIIFVTEIDQTQAMQLAERLRLEIAGISVTLCAVNADADTSVTVTASLGVALAAPAFQLETAISLADRALYQAKAEGRNKAVFYETGGQHCSCRIS